MVVGEKTRIPLFKVFMSPEAKSRVAETLDSGYVGQGPRVEEFENALKEYLSLSDLPLATMSGTHALDLAYTVARIGNNSEVIATPLTCAATNTQLLVRGAKIVWADILPGTGLIDPDSVKTKLTARTKAIVAVDWSGRSCDYVSLRNHGVPVIQDAAHAFGADYEEHGDMVAYSFQAIKHLTCTDGGAVYFQHDPFARKSADLLRWYGLDRTKSSSFRCKQDISNAGYKYGLNDVCASIGLENLKHADWILGRHRENAEYFSNHLVESRRFSRPPWDRRSSWWLYTCQVNDRDKFTEHMFGRGIEVSQVHSRLDTKTCFRASRCPLPGLDRFAKRQISIPVGWWLSEEDRSRIVEAVNEWSSD